MLRRYQTFALAAACLLAWAGPAAAFTQEGGAKRQEQKKSQEAPPAAPRKDSKEPTAEQIAELVVYIYGGRERMAQVQKSSVERGRVARVNGEGATEEATYERRALRGETSAKDKVRLDQKLPNVEYALVLNDGRVWGVINGSNFTPRPDAVAPLLASRHHGLDALLRYKENGSTVSYVGKEKQKNIDMWVIEVADKEGRRTRFYVSTQKWRVLWLEYEAPAGGSSEPVKYRRTFHDYRYAQGQLVPYRTVLYAGGKQVEETNLSNVSFGGKLDDSYFSENPATASAAQ